MKYRVALITKKGRILSENFNTKAELDDYLLNWDVKEGLKRFRILDKESGKIIETESGKR